MLPEKYTTRTPNPLKMAYHYFMAKYYGFLKNRELYRFRKFLRSKGDNTAYTNRAILFMFAQSQGRVKSKIWNDLPWFSTFCTTNDGILTLYKKDHINDAIWNFWNQKEVLIVEGIDLLEEPN